MLWEQRVDPHNLDKEYQRERELGTQPQPFGKKEVV